VQRSRTLYRFILLTMGGLFSAFGSRQMHVEGAGPLGVLTLAFVVNLRWRKELEAKEEVSIQFFLRI
jgi:hypothetical protein